MAIQWYVYAGGRQRGPYSREELWQQACNGLIGPADQVWSESLPGWIRADQVAGLFQGTGPRFAPAAAPAAPPHASAPAKQKNPATVLVVLLAFLLLTGGGAVAYHFLFAGGARSGAAGNGIIGAWHGVSEGGEGYMQFLANGTANLVAPADDFWLICDYRLIERRGETILEIYDREYEVWEETAALGFPDKNTLVVTSAAEGETTTMERISEERFQEVLDQFDFITKVE